MSLYDLCRLSAYYTPHSNQVHYGVCVCFVWPWLRIWFIVKENKTRGVCLQPESFMRCWWQRSSSCIYSEWMTSVLSVIPHSHTAPFTFDPLKRSRVNMRSWWSDKCVDVSLRLICPREALTEHQLAFLTNPTMAPEDPRWCHHTALAAQDIKGAIYFHYTLFRGLHCWNTFTLEMLVWINSWLRTIG